MRAGIRSLFIFLVTFCKLILIGFVSTETNKIWLENLFSSFKVKIYLFMLCDVSDRDRNNLFWFYSSMFYSFSFSFIDFSEKNYFFGEFLRSKKENKSLKIFIFSFLLWLFFSFINTKIKTNLNILNDNLINLILKWKWNQIHL